MTVVNEKIKNSTKGDVKKSLRKKEVILSVKNLKTYFPILGGLFKRKIGYVKAVDDVTFNLHKRETLGLVGESGCGKTTIGNTILNLVPATSGEIFYKNESIVVGNTQTKTRSQQMRKTSITRDFMIVPIIRIALSLFGSLIPKMNSHIKEIYSRIKEATFKIHPNMQKCLFGQHL